MMQRIHVPRLGFSLVELMVALVVVMTLVALALPRYRIFIATSRQAEAGANLGIIATLQQSYHFKNDGKYYTDPINMGEGATGGNCAPATLKNELGFRVADCGELRYTYNGSSTFGNALNDNRDGTAKKIYPNCPNSANAPDKWSIDAKRKLKHEENAVKECQI